MKSHVQLLQLSIPLAPYHLVNVVEILDYCVKIIYARNNLNFEYNRILLLILLY
jgi:hypothetical protein